MKNGLGEDFWKTTITSFIGKSTPKLNKCFLKVLQTVMVADGSTNLSSSFLAYHLEFVKWPANSHLRRFHSWVA